MFTTIRMAACALTFVIATAALADVYCARCRCTVHVNHDTDCPICGQHLHFGGGGGGGGGMGDPGFQLGLFLYQAGPEVKVSRATGASAGVFYPNDTLVQGGFYDTRTGIKYKIWISVVNDIDRIKYLAGPNNTIYFQVTRPTDPGNPFTVSVLGQVDNSSLHYKSHGSAAAAPRYKTVIKRDHQNQSFFNDAQLYRDGGTQQGPHDRPMNNGPPMNNRPGTGGSDFFDN